MAALSKIKNLLLDLQWLTYLSISTILPNIFVTIKPLIFSSTSCKFNPPSWSMSSIVEFFKVPWFEGGNVNDCVHHCKFWF